MLLSEIWTIYFTRRYEVCFSHSPTGMRYISSTSMRYGSLSDIRYVLLESIGYASLTGMRYAETWDYHITPSTFLQFDIAMGCGSLHGTLFSVMLEFSVNMGKTWHPVMSECQPPNFQCTGYHFRSSYLSDQHSNWTRITVYLPPGAVWVDRPRHLKSQLLSCSPWVACVDESLQIWRGVDDRSLFWQKQFSDISRTLIIHMLGHLMWLFNFDVVF